MGEKKYYCFKCKHEHGIFENHVWEDVIEKVKRKP